MAKSNPEQDPEVVKKEIIDKHLKDQRGMFLEQLHDVDSKLVDYTTEKRRLVAQLAIIDTNIEATMEDQNRLRGVMAFIDSNLEEKPELDNKE